MNALYKLFNYSSTINKSWVSPKSWPRTHREIYETLNSKYNSLLTHFYKCKLCRLFYKSTSIASRYSLHSRSNFTENFVSAYDTQIRLNDSWVMVDLHIQKTSIFANISNISVNATKTGNRVFSSWFSIYSLLHVVSYQVNVVGADIAFAG